MVKRDQGNTIGKEQIKVSLSEDSIHKQPQNFYQLTYNFSKVAGYEINSNKSVAFLYTNDTQAQKDIKEITPFTKVTKDIKYLGETLTIQVKDLYDTNFKSFKKEINEDLFNGV